MPLHHQQWRSTWHAYNHSAKFVTNLRINIQDLTSVQVLDIAQMGKRNSGASGGLILKSLKWIFKHANISLLSIMDSPLIAHWDKSKLPRDRAEALPLPLYVIIAWERRLLEKGCTLLEKLLLGSFLLMVWSGVRYSDLQRTIWKSISYNFAELRAICWRTKTCTKGQPYGLLASGFLSRGDHNWLFVFMQSQDSIRASAAFLDDEDFILPEFDAFGVVYPLRPMSYAAALLRFRQSLAIPWRSNSSTSAIHTSSYTVHCMKSTFLSWGSQLAQSGLVTTEQRRQQGHHKALTTSISLYSRDDVHGQVKYHGTLISQVRDGWRPTLPQHRGGQLPTVEPSVSIEAFRKPIPAYNFQTIRVHPEWNAHQCFSWYRRFCWNRRWRFIRRIQFIELIGQFGRSYYGFCICIKLDLFWPLSFSDSCYDFIISRSVQHCNMAGQLNSDGLWSAFCFQQDSVIRCIFASEQPDILSAQGLSQDLGHEAMNRSSAKKGAPSACIWSLLTLENILQNCTRYGVKVWLMIHRVGNLKNGFHFAVRLLPMFHVRAFSFQSFPVSIFMAFHGVGVTASSLSGISAIHHLDVCVKFQWIKKKKD